MNDRQLTFYSRRYACRPPQEDVRTRGGGYGDHDPLGGLPYDRGLVSLKMLQKLLFGLVGEEP